MNLLFLTAVPVMLLFQTGTDQENPWIPKVPDAVADAQRLGTQAAYRAALDTCWRADDWQASRKLADAIESQKTLASALQGRLMRAWWRAGQLERAERIACGLSLETDDRVALTSIIEIGLARGDLERSRLAAERLAKLGPETAVEYYYLLMQRMADQRFEGVVAMLHEAAKKVDPANGYPEIYLEEALDGLPEFFEAIGPEPINQVKQYGQAEMPLNAALRLPCCDVLINGQGPYRMIVDTGGSITLALDADVARELHLPSYGTASVRGISGKQDSQQSLVARMQIGEIACERVMTRTFAMPDIMKLTADGILGTGIFDQHRLTLDFANARLMVAPTSNRAASGTEVEVRIIGDAKILSKIQLEEEHAIALLDSGADVAAVSPARLRALFPDRDLAAVNVAGMGVGEDGAAGISLSPGVRIELWGRTYEKYSGMGLDVLDTLLSPILGVQTDVLIGMPIFRDLKTWTIDFPKRKMWVDWLK